ncbi:MAG TPA: hypothetical protein VFW67_04555 [Burkholderiaceae bacterium]|nr:hypothetical protein [Burkholderiaceae bacterium]
MARPTPTLTVGQQNTLAYAREQLQQARSVLQGGRPHRSLLSTRWSLAGVLGTLLMAAIPVAALLALQAPLRELWQGWLLWWAERLALPLALTLENGVPTLGWLSGSANAQLPSTTIGAVTTAVVMGAYAGTYRFSDRQLPLKYLVRVLCVVQASALLFFLLVPSRFAYTLSGYLAASLDAGFVLMLVLPVLLTIGWGVLRLPLYQKLLYPVLMLGYFALMVPHKALLTLLILQQLSVLFMPLLYLCFGTVLDLMIFVALYSWLASLAPADAVADAG